MRRNGATLVIVLSGLAAATSPLWLGALAGDIWLVRGLCIVALAGVLIGGPTGRQPILVTPAFLLLAVALVFYSLVPAVAIPLLLGPPLPLGPGLDPALFRVHGEPALQFLRHVPGSDGEVAVLAFVGWGALVLATAFRLSAGKGPKGLLVSPRLALFMVLGGGAAFQAGKALMPMLPSGALGLVDSCVPVVLLGMAALVLGCAGWRVTVLGVVLGTVLLMPYMTKAAVMFDAVVLVWFFVKLRGWARLVIVTALIVAPLVGALAAGASRGLLQSYSWQQTLLLKLVARQAESVYCLNFVLRQPDDGDTPFYALAALVPRFVWPDKPNLSNGGNYGVRYCGLVRPPGEVLHSASVTLLGEPFARAGGWGVVVAGGLLAGIVLVSTLAFHGGGAAAVVALALTPYMVDFDQLFALYMASTARAALILTVVLAVLAMRRKVKGG